MRSRSHLGCGIVEIAHHTLQTACNAIGHKHTQAHGQEETHAIENPRNLIGPSLCLQSSFRAPTCIRGEKCHELGESLV